MSWVIAQAVAETVRVSVVTVVQAAVGRLNIEVADASLDLWSRRLVRQAGIRLHVQGAEHAKTDELFVVMSNHQSLYDIPVIFQSIPRSIRMVAKKELFRVPMWGRAMKLAGFVEVDRQNREQAMSSLSQAALAMHANHRCIWIAPEGTRSNSGELGPFKRGGFHLAKEAGVRILPVTISHTRDVLPARGWNITRGVDVLVHISPPIDPKAFSPTASTRELSEIVRSTIQQHLVL